MKVYELISKLETMPAGSNVVFQCTVKDSDKSIITPFCSSYKKIRVKDLVVYPLQGSNDCADEVVLSWDDTS